MQSQQSYRTEARRISQKRQCDKVSREENAMLMALKMEKESWVKEIRWSLEFVKGMERDSPLDLPKTMQPCWHLDFSSVLYTSPLEM